MSLNDCRFGLITDLHYARRPAWRTRDHDQSLDKLRYAVQRFNEAKLDCMCVLGDLVDAPDDPAHERESLAEIARTLRGFRGMVRVLAGNHDLINFSKSQFLATFGQAGPIHGSFNHHGVRMIVLDACFTRHDQPYGNGPVDWTDSKVSDDQLPWLIEQLADAGQAGQPAVVLMHQTLTCEAQSHNIANANRVLDILSHAGNVAGVICGHYHTGGTDHVRDLTIHTIPAAVERSTTAHTAGRIATLTPEQTIQID